MAKGSSRSLCRRHLLFNYKRPQLNQTFSCPSLRPTRNILRWPSFWTVSPQILSTIYHPKGVQKALLSVLDSKMSPFWSHVTSDSAYDLPSKGVQKRAPPKRTLLGVPVFGPVLPRSSCNLPQNMVPGPKSTFWTILKSFYKQYLLQTAREKKSKKSPKDVTSQNVAIFYYLYGILKFFL